jgi:hypothetical protein
VCSSAGRTYERDDHECDDHERDDHERDDHRTPWWPFSQMR